MPKKYCKFFFNFIINNILINFFVVISNLKQYTFKKEQGLLTAKLSLIWNKQVLLDKVNLTLYKCELLGSHNGRSDCSLCLAQAEKYECGWCNGQCKHQNHLRSDLICASQQQDNIKCPFPRIDWVHPLSGPIEGGTQVVIEGSNLGMIKNLIILLK